MSSADHTITNFYAGNSGDPFLYLGSGATGTLSGAATNLSSLNASTPNSTLFIANAAGAAPAKYFFTVAGLWAGVALLLAGVTATAAAPSPSCP